MEAVQDQECAHLELLVRHNRKNEDQTIRIGRGTGNNDGCTLVIWLGDCIDAVWDDRHSCVCEQLTGVGTWGAG